MGYVVYMIGDLVRYPHHDFGLIAAMLQQSAGIIGFDVSSAAAGEQQMHRHIHILCRFSNLRFSRF